VAPYLGAHLGDLVALEYEAYDIAFAPEKVRQSDNQEGERGRICGSALAPGSECIATNVNA